MGKLNYLIYGLSLFANSRNKSQMGILRRVRSAAGHVLRRIGYEVLLHGQCGLTR